MRSSDRPASLARRALPAVALAGLSGVVLTQLDRPGSSEVTLTTKATSSGSTSVPGATSATSSANGGTGGTGNSTVPATPECSAAPVTGPAVDTRWGPVQVTAVLRSDGTICSADAPVTPNDRNRSIRINQEAVPLINDEVKTQGVAFDAIGGATVTSEGYRESLQAILDGQRG